MGENSGKVQFHLSQTGFIIKSNKGDDVLASHAKDNISFVTFLDDVISHSSLLISCTNFSIFQTKPNYIAYCAKDRTGFRACYILETDQLSLTQNIKLKVNTIFNRAVST